MGTNWAIYTSPSHVVGSTNGCCQWLLPMVVANGCCQWLLPMVVANRRAHDTVGKLMRFLEVYMRAANVSRWVRHM
jgi:hypothetical protein